MRRREQTPAPIGPALVALDLARRCDIDPQRVQDEAAGAGGSQPQKAVSFDGRSWWVKPTTNPQGPHVPVTEYVVGRLGRLIEAPVCTVALVEIPADIETPQCPSGIAYGSLDVPGTVNIGPPLQHRSEDDNAPRQVGVHALFDWCFGDDAQWLYDLADDWKLHSHDHGFYFPPAGQTWDSGALRASVSDAHPLPDPMPDGLLPAAVEDFADRLGAVTRAQLQEVLESVPPSWPVPDSELEEQLTDGLDQLYRETAPKREAGGEAVDIRRSIASAAENCTYQKSVAVWTSP